MTRSIKVAKKKPKLPENVDLGQTLNKWSKSIKSWVAEYRLRDKTTTMPSFDSLFNDKLPGHETHQELQPLTTSGEKEREGVHE
jgi:hypothetical protein